MKTVCIYHADCTDGASAAATVKFKHKDALLVPAFHGSPPPADLKGKRVYIVDFSYPAPVLKKIREEAAELNWYDHHKTAIPILKEIGPEKGKGTSVIDLKESGATLTWKQLFPKTKVPKILQYVRDKDIWLWKLPMSREISSDLAETPGILNPSDPIWKKLLKGISAKEWKTMVERGKRSRYLLKRRVEKGAKRGFEVDLDGIKALAVNWANDSSDLGEYIYKDLKYPVALMFSYNGREWIFSLRSSTVDVSDIALRFGGGGHPGAAGFRTPSIEWLLAKKI
jgi:oligoribonuclease NrnB/cAMP/cGMP phosphodiesterase (DHH superfamily)